jgi:uncharacterized protein (DUF1330 family)
MKLHDKARRRHDLHGTACGRGAGASGGSLLVCAVRAHGSPPPAAAYAETAVGPPRPLRAGGLKPHGGRFIVRGGAHETLEGDWQPRRIVVLEFPSAGDAKRWHGSQEYAAAMAMRQRASTGSLVLVEGAP